MLKRVRMHKGDKEQKGQRQKATEEETGGEREKE